MCVSIDSTDSGHSLEPDAVACKGAEAHSVMESEPGGETVVGLNAPPCTPAHIHVVTAVTFSLRKYLQVP